MDSVGRGVLWSASQKVFVNEFRRVALVVLAAFEAFSSLRAQTPVAAGYRDHSYSTADIAEITGEKPESKLWWNDGYWWGSLWSDAADKYRIHRFDLAAQGWIEVGPDIDDRDRSLADALWDGQKLYIASHIYSQQAGPTGTSNSARLYRYSYNPSTDAYSLDAGFPILINNSKSETLVMDKDSAGRLWITWAEVGKIYVNCSLGDDLTWGTPFILPVQGSDVDMDDIATLISFNNRIGVIWSNQIDLKIYFAVHLASDAPTTWQPREVALSDPSLGAVADDHLNLKMTNDGGGNLYVVSKTSLSGTGAPGVYLLRRTFSGSWTKHVVARRVDDYTRPIVMLDDENREAYVFAKSDYGAAGTIRMKKISFDNPSFAVGVGTAFIQSTTDYAINNPSSAKHNVNSTTGLLVIASDEDTRYYFHNYLALASSWLPTITSFSPTNGPVGTTVTITGDHFSSATSVKFNGAAASFAIDSNTQITATVPAGATTGKISVTNAAGTTASSGDFTVTPTQYILTINVIGSGSVDPPSGTYDAGSVITLTATPNSGYQFSEWSGDLTGATNPATITMNGDKNITATFTATGGSGPVVYEETQTGGSSSATTVTTSASLTAVGGHLYLAAIAKKANVAVTGVSGLGLNWTLVRAQCAGRNQTGIEVWMAQGSPSGNGAVTATFAAAPSNAVIAVSRYSSVDATNPLGNIVSGNTVGVNGACSGGADTNTYSFVLTTTVNGAMVYGAATMRDKTHAPGAGYTERAEISQGAINGSKASVAVQDQSVAAPGTIAVDGAFSGSVDWAAIGLEIKPSSGGVTQYNLTTNVIGSGSVNPASGTYNAGTIVTLTATPNSGYQFSSWSGDLSGSTNPATITMNGHKNVTATFTAIPSGAPIVHEETRTGGSANSATVQTSAPLTAVGGHFYLAAISMQLKKSVVAVSGLGLNWTLVKAQCSGVNTTSVEVWMAQMPEGAPGSDDIVTATMASAPSAAVIAVSRYSGVSAVSPIGNMISGNTNGANGICSGGVANSAYSFDLATTANEAVVYAAVAIKARTHAPGAGYTERAEIKQVGGSLTSAVAVEDMTVASAGTITVNGTLSGFADWAVVAVEIKPQAAMSKRGANFANTAPPAGYQLEQNYPNPFSQSPRFAGNPSTVINFAIPEAGRVMVNVYNETGQLVRALVDGNVHAGRHTLHWDARNHAGHAVAAGVYLYRIVVQGRDGNPLFAETRRMTLIK